MKANLLTKNPTKNSLMIWDYEIGFYRYLNRNQTNLDCINFYPINSFIQEYIFNQEFINIEFENDKPKLTEGKIVVLI